MRTIKFRGQSVNGKEWVYGSLLKPYDNELPNYIHETLSISHAIIPDTVGQFTGLTDKNGVEIYEGDIIYFHIDNEKYIVQFKEGAFCLVSDNVNGIISMYDFDISEYEVLGNVYENQELLQ